VNVLLDTHIIIWQFLDDYRLRGRLRETLTQPENAFFVSDVSLWEITIKIQTGKFRVDIFDIEREIARNGYQPLPIRQDHIRKVATLERHHGDPFDHLLVAQALVEDFALLTADEKMRAYPVPLAAS
jgi:PIN domain nuclease of toxin-antitoxin system